DRDDGGWTNHAQQAASVVAKPTQTPHRDAHSWPGLRGIGDGSTGCGDRIGDDGRQFERGVRTDVDRRLCTHDDVRGPTPVFVDADGVQLRSVELERVHEHAGPGRDGVDPFTELVDDAGDLVPQRDLGELVRADHRAVDQVDV